ncbi:MAG: GH36-type glycosyl hydrolase domain-containing protein [Clostridia bacterium]
MDPIFSGLYMEEDKLAAFAANSARLTEPDGEGSAAAAAAALRRDLAAVRRCHDAVAARYAEAESVPPACEWLLDNWMLAQREAAAAYTDLRRAGRQRRSGKEPLMLPLCRALLSSGQGWLDAGRCSGFLRGWQTVTPLRRRELLLFPAAMRAAILGTMAAVCETLPFAADTTPQRDAFEALFSSLRWLGGADMEELLRSVDLSDAALCEDPGDVYARMDRESRQSYLDRLEVLARLEGTEEQLLARRLIRKAREEGRHVGFCLFDEPMDGAGLYIAAVVLTSLFLSLLLAFAAGSVWAAPLLLLPVSELVKGLVDLTLLRLIPPRRLPRLDLTEGVPPEGKTLCVLSTLLTDAESAGALCRRLEELRLAHRKAGPNLIYGILADLPAADAEETEADAAVLRAAREAVAALNRSYRGGFYLFTRPRSFDGERWCGDERKRGALLELAKLLADEPSALSVTGDRDALAGTRYLLTLDSDTRLQPGAALSLIGAMLHPMNRPVIDPDKRVVTAGYGLLHPRISTELKSANATDFALIFAGPGGSDPYGERCGELYMDAFDCGGFAGKGILDVRAFLACLSERIPPQRVLSHDALEGAFLRGGFVGDTVFADGFPSRPLSYYKRLHRWVRGDWQNGPWLFRRGRELRPIDRWRLFDSLRRSLLAPMTLLAILAGFFLPFYGLRLSAWAALAALLGGLLSSLIESARRPSPAPRLRRYARLLTGVGGAIVQSLMRLWLLPWEAWVCLSAISTALWRMLVSRKKLLEWETAAQSEQGKGGPAATLRAMAVPAALGLFCLLLSPSVIGRSAGLLWLLSPAALAALALPAFRVESLGRADRDWLKERAADTWRYFAEFCTEEDHFLPPDNVQHQPPKGPAHRSSPTNMGLAAAAAVSACDLELIPAEEALAFLRRLIGGMERLPRCRGHFYNWYDTRTLQSLHPPFLSAVDSGNCWAGLRVAEVFARERGDEALAARIEALLAPMDFAPLYDPVRGLLAISFDTARGRPAGGWYDLMASEAMLTSYLAVAKGDLPLRHWRRLGRGQLQKDGYRGLASWSGTMFEYLMPALFLPMERGSLLYESSRFCLYAQRRCVPVGQPWGVSESAYFALDGEKNYRYKAHGCPALALRRGMGCEQVIAPYASFLALAVSPRAAVQNLRRLERRGMLGRWGFKDALDLTPGRCRSASGEIVDCTMVHHAGMSLLAAANALCDGSIRRRFFSDPAMRAHELLLQEQPGDGAVLVRRRTERRGQPELRAEAGRWLRRGVSGESGMCLLSNGAYHLLLDEQGRSRAIADELTPYDGSLCLSLDGEKLLPGPADFWSFQEDGASWSLWKPALNLTASAFVSAGEAGECRVLQMKSARDRTVRLRLDFRPVLARRADWESHPSFWRLGLWSEARDGALLLRRLPRGETPGCWLCLRATAPLMLSADENGGLGWLSRPFVTAEAEVRLPVGEKAELRFALCLGSTAGAALEGAARLLTAGETECGRMVGGAATLLGLSAGEIGRAMELLPALTKPRLHEAAPRAALWPYGLSGELPILCCGDEVRERDALLRRFLLLRSAGLEADLVFFSDEDGEYRQPFRRAVARLLARRGLEPLLDASGGVHILPQRAAEAVESRAALCFGQERALPPALELPVLSAPRRPGASPACIWGERSFRFEAGNALPARPWQIPLTNGRLGWLAVDCGSGYLWLENAREMPLTPPPVLPESTEGGEALWLEWEGRAVSLFAANDGFPCTVSYAPGLAVWDKHIGGRRIKTSAFIPRGADVRLLLIEGAEDLELFWAQRLARPASIRCRREGQLLRAENPDAWLPERPYLAGASQRLHLDCDFASAAFRLRLHAAHLTVLGCGCCSGEELEALLKPAAALAALSRTASDWAKLCQRLSPLAADAEAAKILDGWCAYQVVACRLLSRCSLYQAGGAYGFRDQLQDAANLLPTEPGFLRERLPDAARHQYGEGDVMHWWHPHPHGDKGLRSRCSDDLLWLPWALCEYYDATKDAELCRTEEFFLCSPPLGENERDRYETPPQSEARASLLEHARAALDCCVGRGFGRHGLPRMGGGDWNDGLDRAGGESVWLGFFLAHVAARFAELTDALGEPGAARWRKLAAKVGRAADAAFAEGHYLRGYRTDGRPLGGEARIDATVQSWAVLSGFGSPEKCASALDQALERLVDREHRLVKLFDPPYGPDEESPGYLTSYGEGFRENGGQYTHGAVWLALALQRLGRKEEAREILRLLLPEGHDPKIYGAEPFVLPADVYAAPGHEGEAGWTWYTGSAGWFLRAAREIGI